MTTYFFYIAATDCAAKLLSVSEDDFNLYGALPGYCGRKTYGSYKSANMKPFQKNFEFGTKCGNIIKKYMKKEAPDIKLCDAKAARVFLFEPGAEKADPEVLKRTLLDVFNAFWRRAMIRLHTVKPGYEDIHTWMERFYDMETEARTYVPELAERVVYMEAEEGTDIIDISDPIVSLALRKDNPSEAELSNACKGNHSLLGRILEDIVAAAIKKAN